MGCMIRRGIKRSSESMICSGQGLRSFCLHLVPPHVAPPEARSLVERMHLPSCGSTRQALLKSLKPFPAFLTFHEQLVPFISV